MAAIKRYFTSLGFGPATSLVLASLLINGKQTVLEISRSTGIERTKVYRIIDRLLKKNYSYRSSSTSDMLTGFLISISFRKRDRIMRRKPEFWPMSGRVLQRVSRSTETKKSRIQIYGTIMVWTVFANLYGTS